MKNNFKLNKIIFILFIILGVFLVNNVYAGGWKTITPVSGPLFNRSFIPHACSSKEGCIPVCGYHYQKYEHYVSGNQWENSYATIYYRADGKWQVNFTYLHSSPPEFESSGFVLGTELFVKDNPDSRVIIRDDKFDISKNEFRCLNYYFVDLTGNTWGRNLQACFSDSGTKCSDLNEASLEFSKGPKQNSEVKITKTYSIFLRIKRAPETVIDNIDCKIFYKKDQGYIDENGEFKNKEFNTLYTELLSAHILLKILNNGDPNGPFKEIPAFIENHEDSFQNIMNVSSKEFSEYKESLKNRCQEEIDLGVAAGDITPEEAGEANDNINDIDQDDFTPDPIIMKYYMTYTVKGDPIPTDSDCNAILSADVTKLFLTVLRYIQYLGPVLVVVLSTVDFIKAAASGSPDDMKKAWNKLVKRLIAAILLFFVALITRLLLSFFDITVPENCLK